MGLQDAKLHRGRTTGAGVDCEVREGRSYALAQMTTSSPLPLQIYGVHRFTLDAAKKRALIERFEQYIERIPFTTCWIWVGSLRINRGVKKYGGFKIGVVSYLAHRVSYELFRGAIQGGLTLDHLCRQTLCVNPSHLEPTTSAENTLRGGCPAAICKRKTHCIAGHLLAGDNLYDRPGCRVCKTCARERARRQYDRAHKTQ